MLIAMRKFEKKNLKALDHRDYLMAHKPVESFQ